MRFMLPRFDDGYDFIDANGDWHNGLARFAERHDRRPCSLCGGKPVAERLNGRAVGRCALCHGKGFVRVPQIACDDCGQFHDADAMRDYFVGPFEFDGKEHVYAILCAGCWDLTIGHKEQQELEDYHEREFQRRWARERRLGLL
jgi:hypothetical protein